MPANKQVSKANQSVDELTKQFKAQNAAIRAGRAVSNAPLSTSPTETISSGFLPEITEQTHAMHEAIGNCYEAIQALESILTPVLGEHGVPPPVDRPSTSTPVSSTLGEAVTSFRNLRNRIGALVDRLGQTL
jgi:hypothetical protein